MFRVRYVIYVLSLALGRVVAFSVRRVEVYFQGLLMTLGVFVVVKHERHITITQESFVKC
jgi:hypothetical protein